MDITLPAALCSKVDSTSNRNEYQEYLFGGKGGRCVGLTTLPPSCADCLYIREPQPPDDLRAHRVIALPCTYIYIYIYITLSFYYFALFKFLHLVQFTLQVFSNNLNQK